MAYPSAYPGSLDSYSVRTDNVDNVMAVDVNELQSAIVAIETKLCTGNGIIMDTSTLVVDATNHRVGIGTTTPLAKLVVSNGGAEGFEIDPIGTDQVVYFTAYDRVGLSYIGIKFRALTHEWKISTASKMTLEMAGLAVVDGFGCNTKTPQAAHASGGALTPYVTGAYGVNTEANMSAFYEMVVKIRAALVANGIMS